METNTPQGIFINSLRPYHQQKQPILDMQNITNCDANGGNTQHHFREIRGRGHDKSAPTAACGLLITLLTNWNNVANML